MVTNNYQPKLHRLGKVLPADPETLTQDRIWFEQNPGRQYRIRRTLFGEMTLDADMIGFAVIRQFRPGVRCRIGFYLWRAPQGEASEVIARSWWNGLAEECSL